MSQEAPGGLEGHFVEVVGLDEGALPYLPPELGLPAAVEPVQVNGSRGRCIAWSEADGQFVVQLFDGSCFLVDPTNLREWLPPPAEAGGFDLAWPPAWPPGAAPSGEELPQLAAEVAETVARKGWCLLQMPTDDLMREEAFYQAQSLPDLESLKAELVPDYLGRGGKGKVSVLEYDGLHGLSLQDHPWALSDLDRQLTELAKAVAPFTGPAFGFRARGRRKGMVWMPYSSEFEEQRLKPEPLSEDDIDAGVLDAHLNFIRSRRLCFMHWVENEGGELELCPIGDSALEPVQLPMSTGKLLVFRCDQLSFRCDPATSDALSLMTWVVDDALDKARLSGGHVDGGDAARSEALGILHGPAMPVGYRTHVMAMHSHSPCNVHNIDEFGMIFLSGCDGYARIPSTRFDCDVYCTYPDEPKNPMKSYVSHAAMIRTEELENFDNAFFGISEEEARFVAPGQRLVLQDGYVTLHKAGFTKKTLQGRATAAYCGDTGSEFNFAPMLELSENPQMVAPDKMYGVCQASSHAQPGVQSFITAGRLSHCLGMTGGSSTVDTACSASLVGVAVAVQHFRRAESRDLQLPAIADKHIEDAIVFGISCLLTPIAFIGLCGPSMLSPGGRCFTFDVGANGYARGDGYAGAYMKPSESEADHLQQIACLVGCSVNHDGRSATLTAPNGMAQQAVIRGSMREAGLVANQVTIGECHGTGTALGDPIEVGAYRGVMEPRETPLVSTSAKSNIGHLECCAGLTGMLKCCLLVGQSTGSPNVHLNLLNPHLDVDGFPVYFTTEHCDTGLNSNFAGVSSFGFSGTNARADVWSKCRSGPRETVKPDLDTMQVHVQCPVTLGMMELLTGEPVTDSFRRTPHYKADVLREEGASYDVSRFAFEGGFRYQGEREKGADEELDPFVGVYICGSWTAWTRMEEMKRQPDGSFVADVPLGEGRYELFHLCLNESEDLRVYPIVDRASQRILVEGPDGEGADRNWLIDGRDLCVPAGTLYRVTFRWGAERKRISWERTSGSRDVPVVGRLPAFEHSYGLVGTFSTKRAVEMRRVAGEEGTWEGCFRIGSNGSEEFRITRDNDPKQTIYPALPRAMRTTIPVRGPDQLSQGKGWLVRGPSGEVATVRLQIVDARITVSVSTETKGAKVYESMEGWDRHQYSVVGSWSEGVPEPMVMHPQAPGVFTALCRTGGNQSEDRSEYVEAFQIVVDEDYESAFYPQSGSAGSGESIVLGPDSVSDGRTWVVRSSAPYEYFEVCLDLNAADRRKMVTWAWTSAAPDSNPAGITN